ncbi:MAG: ATP-binding protein [Armatimonadota bacterium]|nr:HAMP domain-containing protein [bacterium]
MRRKPLVWQLFPIYFAITVISVLIFAVFASSALKEFYYSQVEADLEVRTRLVGKDIEGARLNPSDKTLAATVRSLADMSQARVTIISPTGNVIADSQTNPRKMENHSDRPEFRRALAGEVGRARRVSPTLRFTMVYLAIPIKHDGRVVAVLRTAQPATALDSAPLATYHHIFIGALLIAAFAVLASLLAVRRISNPLQKIKEAAGRFADGDFRTRAPLSDTDEFASLAETLNGMASQLDTQLRTITQQSGERQAILSSMKEAVIAIDNDDRMLILNPTAERLLGVKLESVKGKTIQEAVRNPDLQRFFEKTHISQAPTTDEIVFRTPAETLMQAMGTALVGLDEKKIGVLVVLNDITQTRNLENMRKDFVANVSHELKTPITSIKGFVETLREGAINDPEKARDFLEIVARQAERLDAIIDDLLALSRIEQQAGTRGIEMVSGHIRGILNAAVANVQPKAVEQNVSVAIECDGDIAAVINAPLLEQAVTNLVDNAVKYSPGGSVMVKAERLPDREIAIRVIDTGAGIEPEHIPRLFERFYRVDKARSRKMGGTGLGLAIVKHIVQAHHGRTEVETSPGKGSTFSIILPEG